MKIIVECDKPKYAKGKYTFTKIEELYNFLVSIKGFPRGSIGSFLLNTAKDGKINGVHTARYVIKIKSDFHDYSLAQKLATETKLIGTFDRVSPKLNIAHNFAKAFDKARKN